ncbi:uncharacterized protein Nmag_1043 [Natrialba magadii ATCC 43099]|uniref:Uncharacterized protein n=1 Tax=Natrialba magadii (strain ATCC 43099 / DSM 3394 / CCM 3739 / CIP 104546 / IAM 13178 / JCM 8861 / NBRC 102185 / NCIMB 2190 / MS3) TaxID=547559 RepID=D3SRC2_NATMM|nr:uncharacterized protein Nmag_1043 [Natrialba magadii ATCC 43099]ELY25282.1 hypothetical protein C500_17731 [Natrialba magadii ATCC 43099]
MIPVGCIVGLYTHQNGTADVWASDHGLQGSDCTTLLAQTDADDKAIKRFHATRLSAHFTDSTL